MKMHVTIKFKGSDILYFKMKIEKSNIFKSFAKASRQQAWTVHAVKDAATAYLWTPLICLSSRENKLLQIIHTVLQSIRRFISHAMNKRSAARRRDRKKENKDGRARGKRENENEGNLKQQRTNYLQHVDDWNPKLPPSYYPPSIAANI